MVNFLVDMEETDVSTGLDSLDTSFVPFTPKVDSTVPVIQNMSVDLSSNLGWKVKKPEGLASRKQYHDA
jgi:hypothetical protein